MGKNTGSNVMSADSTLSLQTYLTRITRVRLRLQQVANASDPQEMMQTRRRPSSGEKRRPDRHATIWQPDFGKPWRRVEWLR